MFSVIPKCQPGLDVGRKDNSSQKKKKKKGKPGVVWESPKPELLETGDGNKVVQVSWSWIRHP